MGAPASRSGSRPTDGAASVSTKGLDPSRGLLHVLLGQEPSCDGRLYLYQPEMHEAAHWLQVLTANLRNAIRMARAYGHGTGSIFDEAIGTAETALASALSALGQDREAWLEPQAASAAPEGGDAHAQ